MVLADLHVDNIYLITGYTDMRKSVPGLVAIIVQQYQMRPDERSASLQLLSRSHCLKASRFLKEVPKCFCLHWGIK